MEIHQLEYFLAVEKYKSFSKAAMEVSVSQSALSQQIIKLEEELGVKLFIRKHRSISLTPAGKDFIVHAKRILMEIEQSKNTIQKYKNFHRGFIRIGVVPLISYTGLTDVLIKFIKSYPTIEYEVYTDTTDALLEKLKDKTIHIAFINTPFPNSYNINFFPIVRDEAVLYISSQHPMANNPLANLLKLKDESFFVIKSSQSFKHDFTKICNQVNFDPKIVEIGNTKILQKFVEENLGVAVTGLRVAQNMLNDNTAIIPLNVNLERETGLAIPDYDEPPILVKMFKDFVLEEKQKRLISLQ